MDCASRSTSRRLNRPGEPKAPWKTWRRLLDRKSTRLNSSHGYISYAVFCLKKKHSTPRLPSRLTQRYDLRGLTVLYGDLPYPRPIHMLLRHQMSYHDELSVNTPDTTVRCLMFD